VLTANCLLIVASLVAAGSLELAWSKARQIRRVPVGAVLDAPGDVLDGEAASSDAPQNYLIVGVDSAEGLDPGSPVKLGRKGGLLSDTIMVLRIDPGSGQAQLLSFPRDLWVQIAGGRMDKINSAIQAGPKRLIETIQKAFGVPINHYIQIDFAGFESIVSAVGGIPVNFLNPVRDEHSLLEEIGPGCINLTPTQALAYARSRYFETKINGKWRSDGTADLGRIDRQQEFIKLLIQRAIQKGARDPRVLQDLLTGGLGAVKVDERITVRQILDLAGKFKAFAGDQLVTYQVPSVSATIQGSSVQLVLDSPAQSVLNLFRTVGAAADNPQNTLVQVHNGTPVAAAASAAGDELRERGFNVPAAKTGDFDRFDVPLTTISYVPGAEARATLLARYLKGPAVLQAGAVVDADVDLLMGADWQGVLDQPRPAPTTTTAPGTASPGPTTTVAAAPLPTPSTIPQERAIFVPTGC
jgi:LCP family protein required for cell wall assembly